MASDVPGGAISWGGAQFGVSEADVLVHLRGTQSSNTVLTWRDHDGNLLETIGEPGNYWDPALSHDGSRLAVAIGTDASDIWIYDLERDSRTRFSFDTASDRHPCGPRTTAGWRITSARKAEGEIWVRPTSGQGDARARLHRRHEHRPDGLVERRAAALFDYQQLVGDNDLDIWVLDMQTLEAKAYLSGKFSRAEARLSPDGKWIAFVSDESGKSEIYVQGFPEADGRWMVSNDGGARGAYAPVWGDDGRELFYKRGNSVLAIPVTPGADSPLAHRRPSFGLIVKSGAGSSARDHGQGTAHPVQRASTGRSEQVGRPADPELVVDALTKPCCTPVTSSGRQRGSFANKLVEAPAQRAQLEHSEQTVLPG